MIDSRKNESVTVFLLLVITLHVVSFSIVLIISLTHIILTFRELFALPLVIDKLKIKMPNLKWFVALM